MNCACGKTAIYRVGEMGYCSMHRSEAVQRIAKFGQPRAIKKRIGYVRMKPDDLKPIVYRKSKKQRKEEFRANLANIPTPAESKLLELLKTSPLRQSFDFQPLVSGYIPDFFFPRSKLIVEADGAHHFTTAGKRADSRRTAHLVSQGYFVLRFKNREIMDYPETTLTRVIELHRARLANNVRPQRVPVA